MPVTSGPQYRLMEGIAHGMKPRGGHGPSKAVAEEFVQATPPAERKRWSHGVRRRKFKRLARKMG